MAATVTSVRIAPGDAVHGLGEAALARGFQPGIALHQGVDHLALHRCGAAGHAAGLARRLQRGGLALVVIAAAVQVRSQRPGLAPGAHGAGGIQQPRLA
jgi:hypothetical protein